VNYEVRSHINAPPDVVWKTLADVGRWPEWTPSVRSLELLDGTLAVGHRVRIRQPKLPTVVWTISEVQPGVSFSWQSHRRGADAIGRHALIDNDDGTSTAVLGLSQTGLIGTLVALASRRLTSATSPSRRPA
jgi:carbon monoxide dehydrogenase subunit G